MKINPCKQCGSGQLQLRDSDSDCYIMCSECGNESSGGFDKDNAICIWNSENE